MQLEWQQLDRQILAAAALAGLAVIWLLWRVLCRRKPQTPHVPVSQQPQESLPETLTVAARETSSITETPNFSSPSAQSGRSAKASAPAQPTAAVRDQQKAPVSPAARCVELMTRVHQHLKTPAPADAASVLREIILLASEAGLVEEHAAARLELGELSRLDGDLITACEHWQIARGLFHDLKNQARSKAVETRMREHGCPTDWVLNDF